MTNIFDETGRNIPVTLIEAGPCSVVQIKTKDNDGYSALQISFGEKRDKPCRDHLVEHGNVLALRKGTWKLIPASAGGGRTARRRWRRR